MPAWFLPAVTAGLRWGLPALAGIGAYKAFSGDYSAPKPPSPEEQKDRISQEILYETSVGRRQKQQGERDNLAADYMEKLTNWLIDEHGIHDKNTLDFYIHSGLQSMGLKEYSPFYQKALKEQQKNTHTQQKEKIELMEQQMKIIDGLKEMLEKTDDEKEKRKIKDTLTELEKMLLGGKRPSPTGLSKYEFVGE